MRSGASPSPREEILELGDAELPAHPVHVLRPDKGAAAVVMCRADIAHGTLEAGVSAGGRGPSAATAPTKSTAPSPPSTRTSRPRYTPPARHSKAGVGPEDVDVIQLQDTDAGAEIIHMAECGFCADGEQEKPVADGATEITGPCRSTPTAASSPTVSRSAPRPPPDSRVVLQLRGQAGDRQVPGNRGSARQVYGAPGTAAASILTT